jgi:spore coat protein U domain-containing protein, fimbrial subunit CupE1/2/3/6
MTSNGNFFRSFFMRKIITATLAAAALAAGVAQAATTTTTTFAVTATVLSTCSASAATLAFPNYTPGGGPQIGNTTISVKCTKNTPFTVALNVGSTTGDAFTQRLMASGANTLQYNLFTTAALATVFGDGTPGSQTVTGTGLGVATAAAVQVFGQLPDSATNQAAVAGSYSDTITVTVTY